MNLYDELEVIPTASPATIRAAYKSLMQRCHPDRNPGDRAAAERTRRINDAYRTLSDPEARKGYDQSQRAKADGAAREQAEAARKEAEKAARQESEAIARRQQAEKVSRKTPTSQARPEALDRIFGTTDLGNKFAKWLGITFIVLILFGITAASISSVLNRWQG